jgi:hypothetical protein
MQNNFRSFYTVLQIQFLRSKHKSSLAHFVPNCNGEITDTSQPSTEPHIVEPTDGTVPTDSVPDPFRRMPSQPTHLSETSVAWVRPYGIAAYLLQLLNLGFKGFLEVNMKVRDCNDDKHWLTV